MLVELDTELETTLLQAYMAGKTVTLEQLDLPQRYVIESRQLVWEPGDPVDVAEYRLRMVPPRK